MDETAPVAPPLNQPPGVLPGHYTPGFNLPRKGGARLRPRKRSSARCNNSNCQQGLDDDFPGQRAGVPGSCRRPACCCSSSRRLSPASATRSSACSMRASSAPADHPVDTAVGGARRARHAHAVRLRIQSFVALIGSILLIGIVKKNRHHDGRFRHLRRARGRAHADRGDPQGGAVALPADHDDDDGRFAWRRAVDVEFAGTGLEDAPLPLGYTMVDGLIVSQAGWTLSTTPVIYLYLDRVSKWVSGSKKTKLLAPKAQRARAGACASCGVR